MIIADLAPPRDDALAEFADRVLFAKTDVTSEDELRAAIAAGEKQFGPLRGVVACAGILHAERVLGRNGVASFDAFRRVIEINLNGTFNAVRLAAEAIARSRTAGGRPPRRRRDDVVGLGVRRPDRPGRLLRLERRRGRADVAAAREFGSAWHPRGLDRPWRLRHADDAGRARQSARSRSSSRSRFLTASATPTSSRHSSATSSKTTCSTAASCASTAPFAWEPK